MTIRNSGRIAAALAVAMAGGTAAQAQPGEREIGRMNGDVYFARDFSQHISTFMVTREGIVLADPISFEFSTWLKGELDERFDVPVRYVLYSHKDYDHASGGAVFADTAQYVGHENLSRHLGMPPANTPLPEAVRGRDANGNGTLERSETEGGLANLFARYDANRDGVLNGAEVTRGPLGDVRPPDITFSDRWSATLGGKTVEMIHLPIEHADDNSIIYYPDDESVFVVDFVLVNRVPFGVLAGEIDEARRIEELDFEHFAPGHGQIGTRADMVAHRRYREDLRATVQAGVDAERSLDQIRRDIPLDEYSDWEFFEQWGPDNVTGIYEALTAK